MVAGMTPSTVQAGFNAAVLNAGVYEALLASLLPPFPLERTRLLTRISGGGSRSAGYHIELAGGGHYNAAAVRSKVSEILGQLETPGLGLTLDSLYINQKQWTFQVSLPPSSLSSFDLRALSHIEALNSMCWSFALVAFVDRDEEGRSPDRRPLRRRWDSQYRKSQGGH
jgi:hypothetical protein